MKYTKTEERTIFKCDFCKNEEKDHMRECDYCNKHICGWHEYRVVASYQYRHGDQELNHIEICPECKGKVFKEEKS